MSSSTKARRRARRSRGRSGPPGRRLARRGLRDGRRGAIGAAVLDDEGIEAAAVAIAARAEGGIAREALRQTPSSTARRPSATNDTEASTPSIRSWTSSRTRRRVPRPRAPHPAAAAAALRLAQPAPPGGARSPGRASWGPAPPARPHAPAQRPRSRGRGPGVAAELPSSSRPAREPRDGARVVLEVAHVGRGRRREAPRPPRPPPPRCRRGPGRGASPTFSAPRF